MTVLNTSNWWLSHTAGAPNANWLAHVRMMLGDGGQSLAHLAALAGTGGQPWLYSTMPAPITNPQPAPISDANPPPTSPGLVPPPPIDGNYVDDQWHFDYLGDIETIWEEYSGAGVHVGIYDDGLQYIHPDLDDNYDLSRQVTVGGEVIDPNFYATYYVGFAHGTSVAGLIGAERNEFGTTGVAWGASLTGVVIFYGPADINSDYAGFIEAVDQTENFDIVNHSWGKAPFFWQHPTVQIDQDPPLIAEWLEALEDGRDGLGTIIVKAAGNDNRNANGDGAATSRATIIVGAYDDDGDASYYSNFGSNLLVSAPSSGGSSNHGIITTDLLGLNDGYNIIDEDAQNTSEGDYTNQFGGTSAATPIVTGVIALMLEANPDLGWRDVQNILAYSAREIGSGVGGERLPDETDTWRYNNADNWNGGGLHYSEDYGFGSVDAYNAVRMAEVWGLFAAPQASANETSYSSTATNVALDDLKTTDILFHFDGTSFDVESVNISLNITHGSQSEEVYFVLDWMGFLSPYIIPAFLSDLDITLISPDGTETTLVDFNRDTAADNPADYGTDQWKADFLANAFRGEDGIGTWTLRINDAWTGDSGTLNSATITLHGKDGEQVNLDDDVYHYTNEVFTSLARDASRLTLNDDTGNDWLDFAAMSGNLVIRLGEGQTSTGTSSAGVRNILTIAAGTDIENVVTGDGDDQITGNALGNKIHGMRGNDTISGEGGADTLSGGAGNDTVTGGDGLDIFLFDRALNASTNVDIITDFSHLDDSVWLDIAIFSGIAAGTLIADEFYVGTSAQDMFQRIIYDSLTGALYYDADGSSTAFAQVQFATLSNHPVNLSFDDFTVVSTDPDAIVTTTDKTTTIDPTVVATDVEDAFADGTPIFGTEGDDTIRAKAANDRIFGFGGTDIITGGAGDDYIDGGLGYDGIRGGDGNDTLVGGGSNTRWGDYLDGGAGDDLLIGSRDQIDDNLGGFLGSRGDLMYGGSDNDEMYGFDGDDVMNGEAGNDLLEGGSGSDYLSGGGGDDRLIGGDGEEDWIDGGAGFDTAVFAGNFDEYRWYMRPYDTGSFVLERLGQTGEIIFATIVNLNDVEALEFADQTVDITDPMFKTVYPIDDNLDLVTFNGYEIGAFIIRAHTFTMEDVGAIDRLFSVNISNFYFGERIEGDITIKSDALGLLHVDNFGGDVTVEAAAGARELTVQFGPAVNFYADDLISDDTATSIKIMSQFGGSGGGNNVNYFDAAEVNGYNLSFEAATTLTFSVHEMNTRIQWYIPNVTTINTDRIYNRVGTVVEGGNLGSITIETALDDSLLATAGGSSEYQFIGGSYDGFHSNTGQEFIRFGNLGDVNMSNDGTEGEDALTNAGLGLRGTINLGGGSDEARILGTGAFQGGTLDGGSELATEEYEDAPQVDVVRMSFAVAAHIGDISNYIMNFEALGLDTPTLTGQVVDVTHFDTLNQIVLYGASVSGGDNTIVNIVDGTTVTFSSGTKATDASLLAFEIFDNQFGTIHLDMAGDGADDTLNLSFVGYAIDSYDNGARPVGLDEGTVHVLYAETVNITTEAYDEATFIVDMFTQPIDYLSYDPTDPFNQVLDLDVARTLTISGETGWDLTAAGTDIGKVTLLDASGVTGYGAVGAVKAIAQTNEGVTFIGGFGDDEFTGGEGYDTLAGGEGGNDLLDGGAGTDRAVFAGSWSDYDIQVADGVVTLTSFIDGSVDTVRGVELFKFANGTVSLANLGTGEVNEPPSVALENVLASLPESTSTASRIKIADIVINDDDIYGTRTLSLTGRDAALFEILSTAAGMALFLKAGVLIDPAMTDLQVAVEVDDDGIDGTPDGVSPTLTIVIEDDPNYSVIRGTSASETVNGTAGNDYIDGNGGDDSLRGGAGDDTYIVDSAKDKVVESKNRGTDTVLSSVTHTLSSYVENLTLTGDGNINGTGNSAANVIIGNAGANVLRGGSGNDTIFGGAGNDRIDGDSGNDLIDGGDGNDYLDGDSGTDTVSYASATAGVTANLGLKTAQDTGGAGVDTLKSFENAIGTDFADILTGAKKGFIDGGTGADEMHGGSSTNTYFVDDVGDQVFEFAKGGTDTVMSQVSYALGANVENLYLTGAEAIDASGNELANRIAGNSAANVLSGGAGKDAFIFNTTPGNGNVDHITDFNVADDTMHIDNAWFIGVGRNGTLSSKAFVFGAVAADSSDRIIYDDATGALYFDADGSGAGAQVQFAQLDAHLALTNRDFLIV